MDVTSLSKDMERVGGVMAKSFEYKPTVLTYADDQPGLTQVFEDEQATTKDNNFPGKFVWMAFSLPQEI